jgi:hypothetical protein
MVKIPKNGGNVLDNLILKVLSLSALKSGFPNELVSITAKTHFPGEAVAGSRIRLKLYTKSEAITLRGVENAKNWV